MSTTTPNSPPSPPPQAGRSWWRNGRTRRLALLALLTAGLIFVLKIEAFLAVTNPVGGEILVIECWYAPEPTLQGAVRLYREGRYRKLVCVAMINGLTDEEPQFSASAARAAKFLREQGIPDSAIVTIDVPFQSKDQTYTCAAAASRWVRQHEPAVRTLDIFTKSVHARKSHLLFQQAFPPDYRIGVIAGSSAPYKHHFWWLSSRGLFVVTKNTAGYLYALVFTPPAGDLSERPTPSQNTSP